MTLSEVKNNLFSFFLENSVFNLSKIDELKLDIADNQLKEALIRQSLEDLQGKNILKKIEPLAPVMGESNEYWVLEQPLQTYSQQVEINGGLAEKISELINFYCHLVENETEFSNKLSLSGRDIENLYLIAAEGVSNRKGAK